MSCTPINKTNEEIINIVKHHGMLIDPSLVQTQEDLVKAMKFLHDNLSKPEGEGARYTFMGLELLKRVSDLPQKVFKKKRGIRADVEHETNDNVVYRDGGSKVHGVMEDLVQFIAHKKGSLGEIKKDAQQGDFALSDLHFSRLAKTAKDLVDQINTKQAEINSEGKAEIMTELRILDPVRDIGGTMDVVVVYSDMTVGIFDYKTMNVKPSKFAKRKDAEGVLIDDPITASKQESYNLSVGEYRRIMIDRYHAKGIRESRIIPMVVRYKPKAKYEKGNSLEKQIEVLQVGADMSKFLRQVPVAGERTAYAGINKLLERQTIRLKQLQDKLNESKLTNEERMRIQRRIKVLTNSIKETITSGDIRDMMADINEIIDKFAVRSIEAPLLTDNTPNPKYLTDEELEDVVHELNVYRDIVENTASYRKDLKQSRPDLYKKLQLRLNSLSGRIQDSYYFARSMREDRILTQIGAEYKDEKGNLEATSALGNMERNFSLMSEMDHPIFQTAWKLIQKAQTRTRLNLTKLDKEFKVVEDDLRKWAKSQGMSMQDAYNKLINFETGDLYGEVSKELYDLRTQAFETGNVEALKNMYQIKDKEAYNKRLLEDAKRAQIFIRNEFNDLQDIKNDEGDTVKSSAQLTAEYNSAIKLWVKNHDLINQDQAWLQEYNLGHLEFKPEVLQKHKSDAYREIERSRPLLNYYNKYTEQNNKFRELLGIKNYKTLPRNFVPNIRRDFIEHLTQHGGGMGTFMKEMLHGLVIKRDEDVYLGDIDVDGELKRTIPLLYTDPLRNRNGEIDRNIKSYDLGKSLRLFGNMAYNYQYMNEIQPKINQLKSLLGDATPDQGGVQVTDTLGRKVKGAFGFATKKGAATETFKEFEDMTDVYLYGIKFKEQTFIKGINTTQLLLKLKEYHAKRALAFAVIPATGAYMAGKVGTVISARKGIHFTVQQNLWSARDMVSTNFGPKKYKAFGLFIDPYAESTADRLALQRSASFTTKMISDRMMFSPLRTVDERITDNVLHSMKYNYGIDENGNLVRMNNPSKDTTGVKTIAELLTYDEKTGQVDVPGMSEDAFIAFRQAVKNAVKGIIGSLSQEEIARYDHVLIMNLMMAFKSWMPGVVEERFGKLKYDPYSQAFSLGRIRAVTGEFLPTKTDFENGTKLLQFMSKTALPAMGRTVLDLATFGIAPTLGLKRVNEDRARRRFTEWQLTDKKFRNATFEEYLEIKEKQIRAALTEIRALLMFAALILFLGGEGGDGEPRWKETWITRFIYKAITKAESEIAFVWNPDEAIGMIRNPIPLASLLTSTMRTLGNGLDESIDLLSGREDKMDKAPPMYYLMQWAYGGSQIQRLIEFTDEQKKSPYTR